MSTANPGTEGRSTEQLRGKATEVKQNVQDMGSIARDAAQEKVQELRETAVQYYDQGRERAEEYTHDFEEYIRQQPLKAVLIAAGVGVFVGLVILRR